MDDVNAARVAMGRLTRAFDRAVAAIDAVADPAKALPLATDLAELSGLDVNRPAGDSRAQPLTPWKRPASALRARTASRLRDNRSLSLAELALVTGVSRARAQQFVESARADDPQPPEGSAA